MKKTCLNTVITYLKLMKDKCGHQKNKHTVEYNFKQSKPH